MREIKWSRDEAGNRMWTGKQATYRVVSAHGPWLLELHPPTGLVEEDGRDDSADVALLTLDECKVFIDSCENLCDPNTAYEMTLLWRNSKKA